MDAYGLPLESLVRLAGGAQIVFALVSVGIPFKMRWGDDIRQLQPLLRKVFWVYAVYILAAHLAFGVLSLLAPGAMLDGSVLARAVTAFIAVWWLARLAIQFLVIKPSDRPRGMIYLMAEVALVGSFVAFAGLYALAFWSNL